MAKNILIVDDEPDILRLAVIRLEASGYKVLQAADGEKALELLNKNSPDLILVDLLLPGMQGDEFCQKLRSDIKFKNIPIILFTASVANITEKAEKSGAQDYILKPFEPEQLLYKIKRLINPT